MMMRSELIMRMIGPGRCSISLSRGADQSGHESSDSESESIDPSPALHPTPSTAWSIQLDQCRRKGSKLHQPKSLRRDVQASYYAFFKIFDFELTNEMKSGEDEEINAERSALNELMAKFKTRNDRLII